MKERPIIFNSAMVCAILDGRKTQTRRIAKPQPDLLTSDGRPAWSTERGAMCQHGQTGDRLWVRETFADELGGTRKSLGDHLFYRADDCIPVVDVQGGGWKPSIHMPRWASRITLEITGVRVEHLQDISREDAEAEGLKKWPHKGDFAWGYEGGWEAGHGSPTGAFRALWESINGSGSWDQNPWVWVIEFKRLEAGNEN